MIGRVTASASVLLAIAFVACASIDPPAAFTKPDASIDPSFDDGGPFERCRVLGRQFVTDASAKVYEGPAGSQAVCVTLTTAVPGAGTGAVVFCVAGQLDSATVPTVRELTPDLRTCAYCIDVQTDCVGPDAGAPVTCNFSYAPLSGRARVVRLGRDAGEPIWIDIGDLEVARVTRHDDGTFDLERRDCIYADGLTVQGVAEPASAAGCTGLETTACSIANTASSRFP